MIPHRRKQVQFFRFDVDRRMKYGAIALIATLLTLVLVGLMPFGKVTDAIGANNQLWRYVNVLGQGA